MGRPLPSIPSSPTNSLFSLICKKYVHSPHSLKRWDKCVLPIRLHSKSSVLVFDSNDVDRMRGEVLSSYTLKVLERTPGPERSHSRCMNINLVHSCVSNWSYCYKSHPFGGRRETTPATSGTLENIGSST